MKKFLLMFALAILWSLTGCGEAFARDPAKVREFRKANPCPVTQKTTGACKGFVVDHIVPLCWGGADAPSNMAWQDTKASYKKDVFERQACAMKKKTEKG